MDYGMDLDWCLACGQHTLSGVLYCSQACLASDTNSSTQLPKSGSNPHSHAAVSASATTFSPFSAQLAPHSRSSPTQIPYSHSSDRRYSFQSDSSFESTSSGSSTHRYGEPHHNHSPPLRGATDFANILPLKNRGFVNRSPSPQQAASWGMLGSSHQ